jgi:hypothetical protein
LSILHLSIVGREVLMYLDDGFSNVEVYIS